MNKRKEITHKIIDLGHVILALLNFKLRKMKNTQKRRYFCLCKLFLLKYELLSNKTSVEKKKGDLVISRWRKNVYVLVNAFLPYPPLNFLNNDIIKITMFVDAGGDWLKRQIIFLEKKLSYNKLKKLLLEDYVGKPKIINWKYYTSHNRVHHLYHLIYFQEKTNVRIKDNKYILEWGGGYGDLARLVKRMRNNITYIMVDLPIFCCVQWIYLSSILGENNIQLITKKNMRIIENKINILPIHLIDKFNLKPDIFIATWSLSESSMKAQKLVDSSRFFGAKHILLAFQKNEKDFKCAFNVGKIAMKHGAIVEKIEFLPGNYYAFF